MTLTVKRKVLERRLRQRKAREATLRAKGVALLKDRPKRKR